MTLLLTLDNKLQTTNFKMFRPTRLARVLLRLQRKHSNNLRTLATKNNQFYLKSRYRQEMFHIRLSWWNLMICYYVILLSVWVCCRYQYWLWYNGMRALPIYWQGVRADLKLSTLDVRTTVSSKAGSTRIIIYLLLKRILTLMTIV